MTGVLTLNVSDRSCLRKCVPTRAVITARTQKRFLRRDSLSLGWFELARGTGMALLVRGWIAADQNECGSEPR